MRPESRPAVAAAPEPSTTSFARASSSAHRVRDLVLAREFGPRRSTPRTISSGIAPTNGGVMPSASVRRGAEPERAFRPRARAVIPGPAESSTPTTRAAGSQRLDRASPRRPAARRRRSGRCTTSTSGTSLDDLETDRARAREHDRIVERVHEREPARIAHLVRADEQRGAIVVEDDLGAVSAHCVDLRARRVRRASRPRTARRPGARPTPRPARGFRPTR